jgi:uncharacterized protein
MSKPLLSCLVLALILACGDGGQQSESVFQRPYDIFQAAEAGDLEGVNQFISDGQWDYQMSDTSGMTPLNRAAAGGHVDVIRLMVQHGARVDFPDLRGKTPLQVAREHGNQDAVNVLQELGARE